MPDSSTVPSEPREISARPAVETDLDALARMHTDAIETLGEVRGGPVLAAELRRKGTPQEVRQSFVAELASPQRSLLVGTIGPTVVGYGVLEHPDAGRSAAHPGRPAVIRELWVEPRAREVGVGSALLDELRTAAAAAGAASVDSVALPGDRATKNFFEDHSMVARAIVVNGRVTR